MKPHARIGHRGAVHLERSLQSSRKREKRGHLPLLRGIPARVEPDGMKRDDQHPADKRGAIIHVPVSVWFREGYGKLSACQYEPLPSLLHIPEHAQIRLQIISGRGLDVGVSELSRDHADVGSGLDRQRAERVTQVAWRHAGEFHAPAPTAVVVCHLVRVQTADQSAGLRAVA